MSENTEETSPYGRGFVAAAIVLGAVLLCGVVLLLTGLTSPPATDDPGTPGAATSAGPSEPGSREPKNLPAADHDPQPPTAPATPCTPAGPANPSDPCASGHSDGSAGKKGASSAGASACGLADGDHGVPTAAPVVDGWEVSRRTVVPRSRVSGPATVDADGFRRCFAHSPTGALFAAYNVISAIGDQRKAVATAEKLMLPGPDTDALLSELRGEKPSEYSHPTQIAAYRVVDASRDRFTVMLALPVQSEYVGVTLTLVWHAGDWRLVPPRPGDPVGAPYSQHSDLDGFVAWSGV